MAQKIMFFAYLKCNKEKTGDVTITFDALGAEEYFAQRKQISVKDWQNIYYVSRFDTV